MKKILPILLSVIMLLQLVPAFAEAQLTSSFDSLAGVPVESSVPLSFSEEVQLSSEDITVTAGESEVTAFALSGSGTEYTLDFTDNMYYGAEYNVTTPYGSISYTTAYDTKTAYNQDGIYGVNQATEKAVAFGRSLTEITVKLIFENYSGTSYLRLYNGTKRVAALTLAKTANETFALNHWEYDANGANGKETSIISGIAATDVVYITYKDGLVYPFAVSADGTVKMGTQKNYVAGSTFDSMGTTNILGTTDCRIEAYAGDGVGEDNTGDGNTGDDNDGDDNTGDDNTGDDNTDDDNTEAAVSSSLNGCGFVPTDAGVPITFKEEITLNESDFEITADGVPVTNFTLDTTDDINYILTVNDGMKQRAEYKITVTADDKFADALIEFETAYATDKDEVNVTFSGNQSLISRSVSELTMYAEITELSFPVNNYKYARWYDTRDNTDGSLRSEKYIQFMLYRQSADANGYGIMALIRNGIEDTQHSITLVNRNIIPLSGASPVITYKDGVIYTYTKNKDGSTSYYGSTDVSQYISDFKVTTVGGYGTSYLTLHVGYADELKAEVIQTAAETDGKIKVEFSADITSFPEKVTITDGDVTSEASVTVEGNTAALTLLSNLSFNSPFNMDLSELKDRFGESVQNVSFITPAAPDFYRADDAVFMINGTAVSKLAPGELTVSMPVKRLRVSDYNSVMMVVALYKKQDGKLYLQSASKAAQADMAVGDTKTLTSETSVTVPSSSDGSEYYAKVFLYPGGAGAFPLVPSQMID